MRTSRILRAIAAMACVAAFCVAMAFPVQAAESADGVWGLLPDDTLGFVVVNEPQKLAEDVEALSEKLELPLPGDPMELLGMQIPAVEHVDTSKPVAMVAVAREEPFPMAVLMLPMKDFGAFVEVCEAEDADGELVKVEFAGDSMFAASHEGYALLVQKRDAKAIDAVKNNTGVVAEAFASMKERMDAADVTGGATRAGIAYAVKEIKGQIAGAKMQLADDDLSNAPMSADQIADALSIYVVLADAFDSAIENGAFTVDVKRQAIVGQDILRLRDKELAKKLAAIAPPDSDWYGRLPAGQTVFTVAGPMPESLTADIMSFSKDLMVALKNIYGMNEDEIDTLFEASEDMMKQTTGGAFVFGIPRSKDAPMYAGSGGLFAIDGDAEGYIKDYAQMMGDFAKASKGENGKGLLNFAKPTEIEVDGRPGVQLNIKIEFPIETEDEFMRQAMDDMMAKLYGPGGQLKVFLVAVDENTVAYAYTSKANLRRYMAASAGEAERTLADVKSLAAVRKHLPADAQWAGSIDIGGYLTLIQRMIPFPIFGNDIPSAPIAFAVSADGDEVRCNSAMTVGAIKSLVAKFASMGAGMAPQVNEPPKVQPLAP